MCGQRRSHTQTGNGQGYLRRSLSSPDKLNGLVLVHLDFMAL